MLEVDCSFTSLSNVSVSLVRRAPRPIPGPRTLPTRAHLPGEFQRLLTHAAVDLGDGDALFCLADCHFHGSDGAPQDHNRCPSITLVLELFMPCGPFAAPNRDVAVLAPRALFDDLDLTLSLPSVCACALRVQGACVLGAGSGAQPPGCHVLPRRRRLPRPLRAARRPRRGLRLVSFSFEPLIPLQYLREPRKTSACRAFSSTHVTPCKISTCRAFPPNARAHVPRYQRAADATEIAGPSLSALARVTAHEQAPGSHGGGIRSSGGGSSGPSGAIGGASISGADDGDGGGRSAVHREAWSNLASMYALGHGVPKCMETARHILRFLDSVAGAEAQLKLKK